MMIKKAWIILSLFASFLIAGRAGAEIRQVGWEELSDRDISPGGRAALRLDDGKWRHAETDHFIYHFIDEKESEAVYLYAESYYKWIKDFFAVPVDMWKKKSHIFIISDEPMWYDLMKRMRRPAEKRSFTNGWELFLFREPFWTSPGRHLSHELTHLIVFRFTEGPIPLFLDEGLACFVSESVAGMQLQANNYERNPLSPLSRENYLPLEEIARMTGYPPKNVGDFYNEGEWFVRFMVDGYGKDKFYRFLREIALGGDFQSAVKRAGDDEFNKIEEKFKEYAFPREY